MWLPRIAPLLRRHEVTKVRLERFANTPLGTFGRLIVGDRWWYTVEPPWKGNRKSVSCIPGGTYKLRKAIHNISTPGAEDDYEVWEVAGVTGRTAIHIHIGNTTEDIEGCICPGKDFGVLQARSGTWLPAVFSSRPAFDEFMATLGEPDEAEIEITWRPILDWEVVT